MSDEIDVSVLNRKCGLIWLASASTRAVSSSFSCSCSRCSIRALFQILIGVATHSTVVEQTSSTPPRATCSRGAGRTVGAAEAPAERLPQQLQRDRREKEDDRPVDVSVLSIRQMWRWSLVKTNGEKCQISSLSGHASRRPPPANPQPTAKNSAMNSPASQRGRGDHAARRGRRRTVRR